MKSGLRKLMRNAGPPVPFSAPGRYGRGGLLAGSTSSNESYLRTFGTSGTIFSIVTLLASSVSQSDWHLYKKPPRDGRVRYSTGDQGSDQRTEVVDHAALTLWTQPNPFYTRFEFVEASQQHLELTGECWWVLDRSGPGRMPMSMWLVNPARMDVVPDPESYLKGYIYNGPNGEQIPLNLDEVVLTKYPNPYDPYRGLGPVQAILVDIDAAKYSSEWNRNFFLNNAIPGGIISVDRRLSDSEFDEMRDRWAESHQGIARAHRIGVLEAGATWQPGSPNQRDMDFANLRNLSRDVLREAWGIHKSMLGNVDDVNRANAQTAEQVFVAWKIIPRLNRIRDALNQKLLPMFSTSGQGVEFDYQNPSPDDREADNIELTSKSTAAQVLVNAGYDPHDVLEVVGLPDMDVAEKATQAPALPPAWVPEQPAAPAPESPSSSEQQAPAKTPAKAATAELANFLLGNLQYQDFRQQMAIYNKAGDHSG